MDNFKEINALVVSAGDNVAVALQPLSPGEKAAFRMPGEEEIRRVTVTDPIPVYHKFAVTSIPKDGKILKYGETIGTAFCDIAAGQHVHLHNVKDKRNHLVLEGRA